MKINVDQKNLIIGNESGNFYLLESDFKKIKKTYFQSNNQIIYLNTKHPKFNFIAADGFYITDKKFRTLKHNTFAVKDIDFVNQNKILIATSGFSGFLNLNNSKSQFENLNFKEHYFKIIDNVRGKAVYWDSTDNRALLATNLGLFSYKNNRTSEIKWKDKPLIIKQITKNNDVLFLLSNEGGIYTLKNNKILKLLEDKLDFSIMKNIQNELYFIQTNAVYTLKNNK